MDFMLNITFYAFILGVIAYIIREIWRTGATRYIVYRSTGIGGPFSFRATTAATSFVDTNLKNETNYYYTVTAVNANGDSANSPVAAAPVSAVKKPQAPILSGYTNAWRT